MPGESLGQAWGILGMALVWDYEGDSSFITYYSFISDCWEIPKDIQGRT